MAFLLIRLSFAQLSERNFGGIGISQGGVRKYYFSRVGALEVTTFDSLFCHFSARGVGGLPLRRHSLCVHAVFSRVRPDFTNRLRPSARITKNLSFICVCQNFFVILQRKM